MREPEAARLAELTAELATAGCLAPKEEAVELVAAAPGDAALAEMVARRRTGEPLAWITGSTCFCGHSVGLVPGVYVPRPQSEELALRAGALLSAAGAGARAADLCTGSGAIALHLSAAAPAADVVGVEIDPVAAGAAARNGVTVLVGDLDAPLAPGAFDVVTAVAPYVPRGALGLLPADTLAFEPLLALDGGEDGLVTVRRVVAAAARLLGPGGALFVELGADQDGLLGPGLAAAGFGRVTTWTDGEGDLRGLCARRPGLQDGALRPRRARSRRRDG